jgi:molybdopterin/thiamine biosynthesis adenylyltransferase
MENIIKRYDRQLRTYGIDTINNINQSSILIICDIEDFLIELIKNASLSGINKIYVLTTNNFKSYINLNEINPYINIYFIDNYKLNQNITIFINNDNNKFIEEINNYTRYIKSSLIVLFPYNYGGYIFIDNNENYIITDKYDIIYEDIIIQNIDDNGIVSTIINHNYQNDDIITFKNLEGTNLYNFKKEWNIEVIDNKKIKLKNFNITNFKFINGIITILKKPIIINNKKYDINDINDNLEKYNFYEYNILNIAIHSILSSLLISESIKIITKKYTPINQWFKWDDIELEKCIFNSNKEINLLIVGAGAIGCELGKNLALMNIKMNLVIIDYDIIELSNLSRQFFFRDKHIGKLKCNILAEELININSNICIKTLPLKVGVDNIDFKQMNLTAVLIAVDNIEARKYMDSVCIELSIPMFDSGTEGLKGSNQPIIPFITESYSNSKDPENENSYPVCTIKTFPNNNVHTIYWALEQFEVFISHNIIDDDYCINFFNEHYYTNINNLLTEHPINEVLTDGSLFWSCGKKCPTPIQFSKYDKMHLKFINISKEIKNNNIDKFDKENDLCIEWIKIVSNIRALNYNIPITDFYITKGIAGKIIPAIPTTTALVAGLTIIELIKYLYGNKNIKYKSNFINLSIPIIIDSEPLKPKELIIGDNKYNIWNKIVYNKNTTLNEFKLYYEKLFDTIINIILFDNEPVYVLDLDEDNLNTNINEIINNNNILVSINSIDNIELPNIHIIYE